MKKIKVLQVTGVMNRGGAEVMLMNLYRHLPDHVQFDFLIHKKSDYDGKVKFVKVNVDEANELASKYNVFSIPTLILLNKGEIVSQQVGAASKESYKNMIERALA